MTGKLFLLLFLAMICCRVSCIVRASSEICYESSCKGELALAIKLLDLCVAQNGSVTKPTHLCLEDISCEAQLKVAVQFLSYCHGNDGPVNPTAPPTTVETTTPKAVPQCPVGWIRYDTTDEVRCYITVNAAQYKKFAIVQDNVRFGCQQVHPFTVAASMLSAEEENAIANRLALSNSASVNIGIVLNVPTAATSLSSWSWVDGSKLEYTNFNTTYLSSYCGNSSQCRGAYLFYNKTTGKNIWYPYAENNLNLLCKFVQKK